MHRIKPDLDIILDILKATRLAFPTSPFIESLLFQYQERGGLSKKQLEGLYHKAARVTSLPRAKIATLEAIILKKHANHKSTVTLTAMTPSTQQADVLPSLIDQILQRYPQHKRVCFLKLKLENKEALTSVEKAEIEKFHKILVLKP